MTDEILGRDMMYYTFEDFMKKRFYIKDKLEEQDNTYKCIYRMYVEARPWMKEFYRNCIWDFLNDYMSDEELTVEYDKYLRKYGDYSA